VTRRARTDLDRLELIRLLQAAQTISLHHGALAYLLGINALRASETAAVRIEHYAERVWLPCSDYAAAGIMPSA
jgi:hypothetical protein